MTYIIPKQDIILCQQNYAQCKNPKTEECEKVEKFIWKTKNRMEVSLITYGARLTSIKIPDRNGLMEDVLYGYDKFEDYACDGIFNFGAIIGPVSGIIKNAEYCMDGRYHKVARNLFNKHCLNSGNAGLQNINWIPHVEENDVILSHATDESGGFPAVLLIQIRFSILSTNQIVIKMTARSNKVCPIDLSVQLYINLSSHKSGKSEFKNHLVNVNATQFSQKDENGLFKKTLSDVANTKYDLRKLTEVNTLLDEKDEGFDMIYKIDTENSLTDENHNLPMVMRAIHASSGRIMEIFSNQPALYLSSCPEFPEENLTVDASQSENSSTENLTLEYLRTKLTEKEISFFKCRVESDEVDAKVQNNQKNDGCNSINCKENNNRDLIGRDRTRYSQNSAFSISCHNFPNAVNHLTKYPEILLKPGSVYENVTILKFKVHVLKGLEE